MKKDGKLYLLFSFLISYICFGIIVYSRISFNDLFKDTIYTILFIIGCLGPFISSFIVYMTDDNYGGFKGFLDNFKFKNQKSIILIPIFLISNYGLNILLKNVYRYGKIVDFLKFLPIMLLLFGLQEIGWRRILQPIYEKEKGFIKSCIITGIIWGIWFFPMILIPQFVISPQFYTQFVTYLVAISMLLSTLYRVSSNISYTIILSTLIFAVAPVIVIKQGFMLMGIAVLDIIIASMFKEKKA